MRPNKKNDNKSPITNSPVKREKVLEKDKNAFAHYLDWKNSFIASVFWQNRAQYLKIFVLSKVLNFVLLVPPVVWFTMDMQTSHLEDRYHARNILLLLFTMKSFCIFSRINFSKKLHFFYVLALENQKAFTERLSLISGALQGLVKICKKYIEVNHFSLLSFNLGK